MALAPEKVSVPLVDHVEVPAQANLHEYVGILSPVKGSHELGQERAVGRLQDGLLDPEGPEQISALNGALRYGLQREVLICFLAPHELHRSERAGSYDSDVVHLVEIILNTVRIKRPQRQDLDGHIRILVGLAVKEPGKEASDAAERPSIRTHFLLALQRSLELFQLPEKVDSIFLFHRKPPVHLASPPRLLAVSSVFEQHLPAHVRPERREGVASP
mmetsp:Transcript_90566/g.202381  ORF Transcript_90566/g.202381 Transcript_90566/m.202381 type:complete len:217 (-) Transcript_90566:107-757(-)